MTGRILRLGGAALLPALVSCNSPDSARIQGYVEGEFLYLASPLSGRLEALHVSRGDRLKAGDPVFELEKNPELEARDEAARRLAGGRAQWEDLKKGKRPSEIESIKAQLDLARAALVFSEQTLARQERLTSTNATSRQDLEEARSARDQDMKKVKQLESDLETAVLGAREDQIEAALANVRALEAMLARAEWDLSQKSRTAPRDGLVFDTLFRPGEWVPAGRPVVAFLPPENIKVRAFIPQTALGSIRVGQPVRVAVDGAGEPYAGRISFISPNAEYTPPVIFSRESRAKLVFMIEVIFDPRIAADLHPGQPVDVEIGA
jgi:HlyD family secretion protein